MDIFVKGYLSIRRYCRRLFLKRISLLYLTFQLYLDHVLLFSKNLKVSLIDSNMFSYFIYPLFSFFIIISILLLEECAHLFFLNFIYFYLSFVYFSLSSYHCPLFFSAYIIFSLHRFDNILLPYFNLKRPFIYLAYDILSRVPRPVTLKLSSTLKSTRFPLFLLNYCLPFFPLSPGLLADNILPLSLYFLASDSSLSLSLLLVSGYLQHLLKLKTLDISKRVYDSMFRHGAPPGLLVPGAEMPKDLSKAPGLIGSLAMGYPGNILAGFPPMPPGTFGPLVKSNPSLVTNPPGVSSEESETSRNLSNLNDDKFYEDMISCSDEDVEEDMEDSTNNNEYDVDMRKYELSSYKMLERNKRREREEGSVRGLEEGTGRAPVVRIGDGSAMNIGGREANDRFPRTNIEYRGDLGELTIETSATPGTSVSSRLPGASPSGRSRKHHHSSSSLTLVPFSSTSSASTSATSPRDRSFIDKASVRQFCTQEGEHIFRCNICLKTYTHISNFCRHFLSAHDDRYKQEISCPVCFKMFTRRDNMMTHTKQVHRITLMRGTLQPVYLDGENGAASQGGNATGSETTAPPPPPPSSTATSTS